MIKDKTHDELVEYVYDIISENEKLKHTIQEMEYVRLGLEDIELNRIQSSLDNMIKELKPTKKNSIFSRISNKIKQLFNKKTNNTMSKKENLTKNDYKEAIEMSNLYENKGVDLESYKNLYQSFTGIESCNSCANIDGRIHNDFQRFLWSRIKLNKYDDLTTPITLTSGKYGSDFYRTNIPYTYFDGLYTILNNMKRDESSLNKRGYNTIHLISDIKTLTEYIELRSTKVSDEVESITVDDIILDDTHIEAFVESTMESVKDVLIKWDVIKAIELRESDMTYKEIASKFTDKYGKSIKPSYVSRQIKQYKSK